MEQNFSRGNVTSGAGYPAADVIVRVFLQIRGNLVSLRLNCEPLQESYVSNRRPKKLDIAGSTLYIGQAGAIFRGAFEVREIFLWD